MDDLIQQLLLEQQQKQQKETGGWRWCCRGFQEHTPERLTTLLTVGRDREYLGKGVTASQVDAINDKEVQKLYARYEARLGGTMTQTLGWVTLQLYAGLNSTYPAPPGANRSPSLISRPTLLFGWTYVEQRYIWVVLSVWNVPLPANRPRSIANLVIHVRWVYLKSNQVKVRKHPKSRRNMTMSRKRSDGKPSGRDR